jgi:hypothetical protein
MISTRAEQLAPAIGVDTSRLLDWCTAFAGMVALELAEAHNTPRERIEAAVSLAEQAPAGRNPPSGSTPRPQPDLRRPRR